jgi:hypothetical protein
MLTFEILTHHANMNRPRSKLLSGFILIILSSYPCNCATMFSFQNMEVAVLFVSYGIIVFIHHGKSVVSMSINDLHD